MWCRSSPPRPAILTWCIRVEVAIYVLKINEQTRDKDPATMVNGWRGILFTEQEKNKLRRSQRERVRRLRGALRDNQPTLSFPLVDRSLLSPISETVKEALWMHWWTIAIRPPTTSAAVLHFSAAFKCLYKLDIPSSSSYLTSIPQSKQHLESGHDRFQDADGWSGGSYGGLEW